MATGVTSWKLAKGLYIVPLLFAYTPLLSGDWPAMAQVFGFAVVGIYAISAALQGCMEKPFGIAMRGLCAVAGLGCLWPGMLLVNLIGAVTVAGLLVWNIRHGKTAQPAEPLEPLAAE